VTFTSDRGEQEAPLGHPKLDIWTADPDGGNPRRLTFDGLQDDTAELSRWSPDRRWIGFQSITGFDAEFFPVEIIRPDGTGRRVLAPRAHDSSFSWSPDATQIAYTFRANGKARIYILDVATGSERILQQKSLGEYAFPTWSPDGTMIAFLHETQAPTSAIHIVPVTGGPATNIGIQAESIDWQPIPDFPLVDARFSSFESSIRWLHGQGLTSGCAPERYCPDRAVSRGELASFLSRALDLPPATQDHFSDDDGMTHEDAINRVAEADIVQGCGPDAFCPTEPVTRAQLATFFVEAFDLLATSTDPFVDDASSSHEADINALAESGITTGCAPDRYCPTNVVRRGQLAAFLRRAIEG
jgi:S-layer homology domain/WD40-like Beta Propeller Repeat